MEQKYFFGKSVLDELKERYGYIALSREASEKINYRINKKMEEAERKIRMAEAKSWLHSKDVILDSYHR